jgi:hypothetical protein
MDIKDLVIFALLAIIILILYNQNQRIESMVKNLNKKK